MKLGFSDEIITFILQKTHLMALYDARKDSSKNYSPHKKLTQNIADEPELPLGQTIHVLTM